MPLRLFPVWPRQRFETASAPSVRVRPESSAFTVFIGEVTEVVDLLALIESSGHPALAVVHRRTWSRCSRPDRDRRHRTNRPVSISSSTRGSPLDVTGDYRQIGVHLQILQAEQADQAEPGIIASSPGSVRIGTLLDHAEQEVEPVVEDLRRQPAEHR